MQRVRNGPEWTSGQKSFFIDFLIPSKLCFLQIYQKLPPCVSKMCAKIGANYWWRQEAKWKVNNDYKITQQMALLHICICRHTLYISFFLCHISYVILSMSHMYSFRIFFCHTKIILNVSKHSTDIILSDTIYPLAIFSNLYYLYSFRVHWSSSLFTRELAAII